MKKRAGESSQSGSATVEMIVMFAVLLPIFLGVSIVGKWFEASSQMQMSARHAAFHGIYTESELEGVEAGLDGQSHLLRQSTFPMGQLEESVYYNGQNRFEFSGQPVEESTQGHKSSIWSSSAAVAVLRQIDLGQPSIVLVQTSINSKEVSLGDSFLVPKGFLVARAAFPTSPWTAVSGQDANNNLDNPLLFPASRPDIQIGLAAMAASNASLELLSIPLAPKLGKLDFWADIKPDRDASIQIKQAGSNSDMAP